MMAGGGPTPGRAVRMQLRDAAAAVAVVRVRRFGVDPFGSQKYSAAAACCSLQISGSVSASRMGLLWTGLGGQARFGLQYNDMLG